jgi:hypothetical protein
MSRALLEDAADSVGGGVLFVAVGARVVEFVAAARGLLLLLDVEGAVSPPTAPSPPSSTLRDKADGDP